MQGDQQNWGIRVLLVLRLLKGAFCLRYDSLMIRYDRLSSNLFEIFQLTAK